MGAVYSKLLYHAAGLPAGAYPIYTAPAGFVAVVRSIVFFNDSHWYEGLNGIRIYDHDTGAILAAVGPPYCQGTTAYPVELRQVVNTGEQLYLSTTDLNWSARVSGFELSLP